MNNIKIPNNLATDSSTNEIIISLMRKNPGVAVGSPGLRGIPLLSGSNMEVSRKIELDDLFPDYEKLPLKHFYFAELEDSKSENLPITYLLNANAYIQKEEKEQKLIAEKHDILKLLDQWSKEPQLGDDQWWDNFDRELREIRKSGWERS